MRRLGFAVVGSVTLLTSPALAADVLFEVGGISSGTIWQGAGSMPWDNGALVNMSPLNPRNPQSPKVAYGGSTETVVSIDGDYASFESGVAVSGVQSRAESNSGLNLVITNGGTNAFTLDSIESTILPAGLGIYIQDRSGDAIGSNVYTGYGDKEIVGVENPSKTFASFYSDALKGQTIATAGFTFDIFGDDYDWGEGVNPYAVPLFTLSGELTLGFDMDGKLVQGGNIALAGLSLADFEHQFDTAYAQTYRWSDKDITVLINQLLNPGESTGLYYRTTAYAQTNVGCLDVTTCIVAYSGFGDPVGRGGGASRSMAAQSTGADQNCLDDVEGILCIKFDPKGFNTNRLNITEGGGSGAVPEPATWMTLILGFAGLGAALRRRRALAYS